MKYARPATGEPGRQGVGGQQVGGRGVFHVHRVDQVRAVANAPQPAAAGASIKRGTRVPVARSPHQVRPQRASRQSVSAVGGQHVLLGQRLRMGVVAEPTLRIRNRLVDALLVTAVEGDARAAGVDQAADPVGETSLDDVPGAEGVGLIEMFPGADHAGDAADVEHHIHPRHAAITASRSRQIGADGFDAKCIELRIVLAADRAHAIAPGDSCSTTYSPRKPPPPVTNAFTLFLSSGLAEFSFCELALFLSSRRISMHRVRQEGRSTHGDIFRSFGRRRAVLHPLAGLHDDRPPGFHVELAVRQCNVQASLQNDCILVELQSLSWFRPARRTLHASDTDFGRTGVDSADNSSMVFGGRPTAWITVGLRIWTDMLRFLAPHASLSTFAPHVNGVPRPNRAYQYS